MAVINTYNLTQNISWAGVIAQDVSIGIGIGLFLVGLFQLKRYGEARTFMSQQLTIAKPLMTMLGGMLLLILPTAIRTGLLALWGSGSVMAYHGPTNDFEALIPPIIMIVRLIGVGAFIRGCTLIARAGSEHAQQGTLSKGVLHIIGGLLCVNIMGTVALLETFFDFTGIIVVSSSS